MTTEAAAKKDTQKLQRAIIDGLEDVKAQDIAVFDTEHLSPLFERVIIASGTSNRQTKALASSVRDAVREAGFGKPRIEGEENGEWIIVDCGAAVAHIMQPAIRQYYHLEEIWGDKPVRTKLGSSKPASPAKVVEEKKPAVKQPTTLRRSSAAKTAIRAAELEAKAAKGPSRRAPARKASANTPVKVFGKPAAKKAAAKSAPRSAAKPAARPASKTAAAVKKPARKAAPKNA
ncbi:ribosome-associated protein [Variovorax sp. GrIS 2.14]|uniref:ribosome silencing factor n=1 Tax=Variovorax sp. GrIS 2.14 TaxID=3071709 RepID=UPI0038F67808